MNDNALAFLLGIAFCASVILSVFYLAKLNRDSACTALCADRDAELVLAGPDACLCRAGEGLVGVKRK